MHCFLQLLLYLQYTVEDLERHDGSAEKPYYMSKELMNIVGKKNKFQEKEDDD